MKLNRLLITLILLPVAGRIWWRAVLAWIFVIGLIIYLWS
jgi:hypothetical protein